MRLPSRPFSRLSPPPPLYPLSPSRCFSQCTHSGPKKDWRLFGGAGIIYSRGLAHELAPKLAPYFRELEKKKTGPKQQFLLDIALPRFTRESGFKYAQLEGLYSQTPAFYLTQPNGARDTPHGLSLMPATFHYVRRRETGSPILREYHPVRSRLFGSLLSGARRLHAPPRLHLRAPARLPRARHVGGRARRRGGRALRPRARRRVRGAHQRAVRAVRRAAHVAHQAAPRAQAEGREQAEGRRGRVGAVDAPPRARRAGARREGLRGRRALGAAQTARREEARRALVPVSVVSPSLSLSL